MVEFLDSAFLQSSKARKGGDLAPPIHSSLPQAEVQCGAQLPEPCCNWEIEQKVMWRRQPSWQNAANLAGPGEFVPPNPLQFALNSLLSSHCF